jgi:glycosyltransferase involved in cell wall biosynthesis
MRIFVLGFPHTQTLDPRDENLVNLCTFTEQVWYFCQMMVDRGHEVIHVGTPGSRPPAGVEQVDVVTEDYWRILYGWRNQLSPHITSGADAYGEYRRVYAANTRKILMERGGKPYTSIICVLWGTDDAVKDMPQFVCEYGIGYPKVFAPYRVYLSNAWRHFHEGQAGNFGGDKWYWQVIPLAVNLGMFGPVVPTADKLFTFSASSPIKLLKPGDPYFMVQTRMHEDKGVRWAVQIARELKTPIILTGKEDASSFIAEWPEGASHLGLTTMGARRELMRHARALFSLTRYMEPLGAVVLEAQASGCPVISTDFGGYVDTVVHGGTGWRVNTFEESVWAARHVDDINPFVCREWIARNHSLAKVGQMYEDYFEGLLRLEGDGGRTGWNDAAPALTRKMLWRAHRDYSMFGDHHGAYSVMMTMPGLPSPPTAAAEVDAAPPPPAPNPTALPPAEAAVFSPPPAP